MIVEIDLRADGTPARLLEPDVFTAFKVVLRRAGRRRSPAGSRRPASRASTSTPGCAIDALRELAGPAATPEWEQSLAGMLEFARSRGWVDDEPGLRSARTSNAQEVPA